MRWRGKGDGPRLVCASSAAVMVRAVLRQLVACTFINISVFIAGNALGWPSPVLYSIEKEGKPMNMTHSDMSLMVSILYVGNMASPLPSGALMDMIGRKMTLHVLSIVPLASWIMVYFAKTPIILHISRLLAGCWFGTLITVVPTYVGEVTEPRVRGAFSTIFQLMANGGVLFVFLVGPVLEYYLFTIVLGVFPVIFFLSMFFIPESPYWQTKMGKHDLAAQTLSWLRGKPLEEVKEELADIEEAVTADERRSKSYRQLVSTKGNRKALLVVEVLALVQRASGVSALLAYLSTSLPEEGPLSPNDCVIVIGAISLFSVFMSTFLVDRSGRVPLLIISCWGCAVFMFIAGLWYFLDMFVVRQYAWVPFAALVGYSFFFSVGLGPLQTTIQGEVFATSIKGQASGITAIVLAFASFSSNIVYFEIADSFGMYMNYVVFTLASVVGAIFSHFWVVETKGKSLNQIQKELNSRSLKT